jgi:putative intracellular protease/amidase
MPVDPRTLPTDQQKLDWQPALKASENTVPLQTVQAANFDAVFIPGGHGPMFDLPDDPYLQRLLRDFHSAGKIIAAVCHGPCGLVNATRADGQPLVKDVTLTSYTYSEEVAAKLDKQVPFILEEKLIQCGANFIARENRANHVERDGQFITGQNPFSSESVARSVMAALQHRFPPQLNNGPDEVLPAKTVAEFPAPSFIENITVAPDGVLYVSSLEEGAVYKIGVGAKPELFAKLPVVAGLVWSGDDTLIAASTAPGAPGIYKLAGGKAPELVVPTPEAKLLNGLIHLSGSRYLVADSYDSCIREADISSGATRVWLRHLFLAHAADPFHPVPQFPGVNGLKRFGNILYASSTEQQKLIQIPLTADLTPGEPRVFMTLINIDDFAFDTDGNLYGATHVYNSVLRIKPDRQITVIAGLEQGMAGSTALAFGKSASDRNSIYVTTNGGMSSPPRSGIQPGRVVRLAVGKTGYFGELS